MPHAWPEEPVGLAEQRASVAQGLGGQACKHPRGVGPVGLGRQSGDLARNGGGHVPPHAGAVVVAAGKFEGKVPARVGRIPAHAAGGRAEHEIGRLRHLCAVCRAPVQREAQRFDDRGRHGLEHGQLGGPLEQDGCGPAPFQLAAAVQYAAQQRDDLPVVVLLGPARPPPRRLPERGVPLVLDAPRMDGLERRVARRKRKRAPPPVRVAQQPRQEREAVRRARLRGGQRGGRHGEQARKDARGVVGQAPLVLVGGQAQQDLGGPANVPCLPCRPRDGPYHVAAPLAEPAEAAVVPPAQRLPEQAQRRVGGRPCGRPESLGALLVL